MECSFCGEKRKVSDWALIHIGEDTWVNPYEIAAVWPSQTQVDATLVRLARSPEALFVRVPVASVIKALELWRAR